jgi:hypothetical protein
MKIQQSIEELILEAEASIKEVSSKAFRSQMLLQGLQNRISSAGFKPPNEDSRITKDNAIAIERIDRSTEYLYNLANYLYQISDHIRALKRLELTDIYKKDNEE